MNSNNLRASPYTAEEIAAAVEILERSDYVVGKPGSIVTEPPQAINDALVGRMGCLVSDLQVIDGMARRGAVLSETYRAVGLLAIRRFADRIFDALAERRAAVHPWSGEKSDG